MTGTTRPIGGYRAGSYRAGRHGTRGPAGQDEAAGGPDHAGDEAAAGPHHAGDEAAAGPDCVQAPHGRPGAPASLVIADDLPDGLVIADEAGRVQVFNAAAGTCHRPSDATTTYASARSCPARATPSTCRTPCATVAECEPVRCNGGRVNAVCLFLLGSSGQPRFHCASDCL